MIKREKRRYLALKVETEQSISEQEVFSAVQESVIRLFGEYGISKANLKFIKYIQENGQFVFRCSHVMLDNVRAAITSIISLNGKNVTIHVINVSGTLKGLNKKQKSMIS